MKAITLVASAELRSSAAEVWAVVADYARDPEWRTGVVSMVPTPPGPVGVGTTTAERIVVVGRTWHTDGEVTALDPGRRFEWVTTRGARAHGSRTVEPLGPGACRVRLELVVSPVGAMRLVAPILARTMRRDLQGDLGRLATLVLATAPGHAP